MSSPEGKFVHVPDDSDTPVFEAIPARGRVVISASEIQRMIREVEERTTKRIAAYLSVDRGQHLERFTERLRAAREILAGKHLEETKD